MQKIFKSLIFSLIILSSISVNVFAFEKVNSAQELENSMYNNLKNWNTDFVLYYEGNDIDNSNKIKDVFEEACKRDDYLERSVSNYRILIRGTEQNVTVTYRTTKEQETYINSELKRISNNLIDKNMTDIDKVVAINNYLVKIYKYDDELKSDNVYSALTTGKTICQGYAMTAYKMFNFVGIESRIVIGTMNNIGHAWNQVKVNGQWYHLDVTNNDNVVRDKYLLVSDGFLKNSGFEWDNSEYSLSPYNYYKSSTSYVDYNNDKEKDISQSYNGGYWYKKDGFWYYWRGSGVNALGWLNNDSNWYYLGKDGKMKLGWVYDYGNWYYLSQDGRMKTGWIYSGNKWYCLGANGELKTGWIYNNGNWYYLGKDGGMKIGWIYDQGNWYYCWSDGKMAYNTVVNGYKLNSNGAWTN
ncbi:transglutaminase domain-containing protein [Clostridium weizhouense]|uniref:Cell wall-binding protein n=1 Tax=Clostridium weizhouense TaxID=2859781 RepID=A0ABS7APW0_9CLOT|nr:transglutaminase-like domain-containing protein [Clostridium weizhouense]MBW6410456.1 cell wall-binding protein [Clostridium weizhouense]